MSFQQALSSMNIFVIPSWYPSKDHPLTGIFILEQIQSLARANLKNNFAISLWGQMEEGNLLWANDHLKNIRKITKKRPSSKQVRYKQVNLEEYYTPAFTWTNKILSGNLNFIIKANDDHLTMFAKNKGNVSLIHAHVSFPAGYIAQCLSEKYDIPYIITEHMSPFPFDSFIEKGNLSARVLNPIRHADAVIAVSPAAALDIQQKTGVKPVVIPNLVDEKLFTPSPDQQRQYQTDEKSTFTFFTLGRMVPQKGIPDLVKAISIMRNKNARFKIGGDGEHLQEYQRLAEALQADSRIEWLGELSREAAAEAFRNCHAFVLPSVHESMGVVYAEALASGKPIIATRCGGPEFMVKEHNGLLVDVHAPDQLAAAMDYLLEHHNSYSPATIREDFMDHFSSTAITAQIYSLYKAVVSGHPEGLSG